MNKLLARLIRRISVVHALPGRIRLHVPLLAQAPAELPVEQYTSAAAEAVEGVASISASRVTSNIVIRYDPAVLGEEDLLALAREVVEAAARNAERVLALDAEQQRRFAERLAEHYRTHKIKPGERLAVPDDVWSNDAT